MRRRPTTSISATKAASLAIVKPSTPQHAVLVERDQSEGGGGRRSLGEVRERRDEDERQHHREILDDEPPDRDPSALALDDAPFLQRAEQHDRARDREAEAEDEAAGERPAEGCGEPHAEQRRDGDLANGAGNRDAAHGKQVVQRESAGRRRT